MDGEAGGQEKLAGGLQAEVAEELTRWLMESGEEEPGQVFSRQVKPGGDFFNVGRPPVMVLKIVADLMNNRSCLPPGAQFAG